MDLSLERDSTALGSLFQQIITDMKNTSPLWEDFVAKASKLHACLRAAIQAIAAYLDAFQKIADAATNSRGASKEIGTALTRVCLRHKAVETRMKTFTSAIMDCLITPLQDKLEDWKRQVITIDKEHTKEYKRCRTELKKRSSDTLRLQKKARKGQSETIQSLVDSHMQDVTMRRADLEEVERKSLRAAMIEERMRYCNFVNMLQPVVKEECEVMSELGHLQEAMQSIAVVTKEPNVLPQSSEELILESKSTLNLYPESPGGNSGSQGCSNSLGSRKSSVCSISSMNSSGSSGSPGHHHYQRSLSQLISPTIRLKPGESSDSGFCSSPALTSQVSTATSQSHAVSTWPPHSQDVQPNDRPHTISSAYEKGHQRPALTVYTFQNPETIMEAQKSPAPMICRPPLPVRCSSLERPLSSTGTRTNNVNLTQRQCPSPIPVHITKELSQHQPTYVNMSELASMAAMKITNQQVQQQQQNISMQYQKIQYQQSQSNSPSQSKESSQVSSDSLTVSNNPAHSSSHISLTGNTTTILSALTETIPSSGDSPQATSQNNSPQLTNSSEISLTGGNSCLTPGNNKETSVENELKITETETNISNTANTSLNNQNSSTDKDEKSRGSVLEKTSMFEKLEQKQAVSSNPSSLTSGRSSQSISSGESIYGSRKEDSFKTPAAANDKDPDQIYEDSIQELNNLIGELDTFQREHEMKEQMNRLKNQQGNILEKDTHQSQSYADTDSDKISIGSLNYSTQSTNASNVKLTCSDSELSEYVSESSSVGFENPTFAHFNSTDDVNSTEHHDDSESAQITIYNHNFVVTPDVDYLKKNSEIVVLRCKDTSTLDNCEGKGQKQRFSSFRCEQQSPQLYHMQQQDQEENQIPQQTKSDQGTDRSVDYCLSKKNLKRIEKSLIDESSATMKNFKANLDERLRSKPTISPRPASLSGCVTRIARRSSINNTKPPPPVRRSSSVTPSHNLAAPGSPNLIQQNVMNTSVENLPPPPAYLLDRTTTASPTINVAETVKALTVIRHTPASPSALRRVQNHVNQTPSVQSNKQLNNNTNLFSPTNDDSVDSMYTPQSPNSQTTNTSSDSFNSSFKTANSNSPGIYAQPKHLAKMSSFRSPSPAPQKASTGLLAQLNSRLTPNKQSPQISQQLPQANEYEGYHHTYHQDNKNQTTECRQSTYSSGPNSPHHQNYVQPEQIYSRAKERYYYGTQQEFQQSQQCDDYAPTNTEKSGSIRSKTKTEFLENLNAKLAKQSFSGRAFAVRNLINSKALSDPRLCHESLMDQIKRGATLKRNRTINDRSAPKIH